MNKLNLPFFSDMEDALLIQRCVRKWLAKRAILLLNQAIELFNQQKYMTARSMLNKAILLGNFRARAYMAWILMHTGSDTLMQSDPRYQHAVALVELGTRMNCGDCEGVLAYCYTVGKGMNGGKMDHNKAWDLATISYAKRSVFGMFALGHLIKYGLSEKGISFEQGAKRSVELLQEAKHKGFPDAYKQLIMAYESGFGVPRDYVAARILLEYLVNKGDGWACSQLASYYKKGQGVKKNLVKSLELDLMALGAGY